MFNVINSGAAGYLKQSVPACNLKRPQSKSVLTVQENSWSLSSGHNSDATELYNCTRPAEGSCKQITAWVLTATQQVWIRTFVCRPGASTGLENGASGHRLCWGLIARKWIFRTRVNFSHEGASLHNVRNTSTRVRCNTQDRKLSFNTPDDNSVQPSVVLS